MCPKSERFVKDQARKLIEDRLDGAVRYERMFARIAGGAVPGLFLSQAWYWAVRTTEKDGWFYKTMAEWTEETGLTRSEQETARKRLEELGLLACERKGEKGRLHFKINARALYEALSVCGKPTNRNGENQQTEATCLPETSNPVCGNPAIQNAENLQTLPITKTTTETTTVIRSPSAPRASRLKEDWVLSEEWRNDAVTILRRMGKSLDIDFAAESFKDYWLGKAGKDATKTDWRATWRNWVRNARPPDRKPPAASTDRGATLEDQFAIEMAAVARMSNDGSNVGRVFHDIGDDERGSGTAVVRSASSYIPPCSQQVG